MTITRRTLLAGLAAAALRPGILLAQGRRKRVGIVGGGIIGAAVAARLAMAGADVILFEKEKPAAGSTGASVGWINAFSNDARYMRLRAEGVRAWREDDALHGMGAMWGGSVNWVNGAEKRRKLEIVANLLRATDDPPRLLTGAGITEAAPGIFPGSGVSFAFQTQRDGHVDPMFATERYLTLSRRHGATVLYPCEVTDIQVKRGNLSRVATTRGDFDLDILVSAAGADTPRILALVGQKLELPHRPGLIVLTKPLPFETNKVFEADGYLEFKQYYDGRVLSRFDAPSEIAAHAAIRERRVDWPDERVKLRHGQKLISETAKIFPAIAKAEPSEVLLGLRPYPLDNRPIIGPVPGVRGIYALVTHSGITLAPILGRYAALEIMGGADVPILAPYRPGRYISA